MIRTQTLLALIMFATLPAVTFAQDVPVAGRYVNDPNHTSMTLSIGHLSLAPYTVALADVDITLEIDPANPTAASVTIEADANSVVTTYRDDYQATHPDSSHTSWEDAIAMDFLGAALTPTVTFVSSSVEVLGESTARVTGMLTLAGTENETSFEVELTGATKSHVFTKAPALGISAEGEVKRSDHGIAPQFPDQIISDAVTVRLTADMLIDGELKIEPSCKRSTRCKLRGVPGGFSSAGHLFSSFRNEVIPNRSSDTLFSKFDPSPLQCSEGRL